MGLNIPNEEFVLKEIEVQNQILRSIDNFESLVFSAGAGSGKTYALTESLKYIAAHHGARLSRHNQHVICITYTNAATAEIKERLGTSKITLVSTIHERLWSLIKDHQRQLVEIHANNLRKKIGEDKNNLTENNDEKIEKEFGPYRRLDETQRAAFESAMTDKLDLYYSLYEAPAKMLRAGFKDIADEYPDVLKSIANFRKTVNTIVRIRKFESCIEKIETKSERYREIRYDSRFNKDILHRMIISHDTLLDYGLKIIDDYDLLKQIIIDKYPYILIDEYQDTNPHVVKIMHILSEYNVQIGHNFFVGYFGDAIQNIYDDGVGSRLTSIHTGLNSIDKIFNRRSYGEIIQTINKIRNDPIEQKSIYTDCHGGSVEFNSFDASNSATKEEMSVVHSFINTLIEKWNISKTNRLHCLVLTNKLVARLSGFENLYRGLIETKHYKRYWDQANTEILSTDLTKLGSIPNMFFGLVHFHQRTSNPNTTIAELLDRKIIQETDFSCLGQLVSQLKALSGNSLGEFVQSIFIEYSSTESHLFKRVIDSLFDQLDPKPAKYQDFVNIVLESLYPNLDTEDRAQLENARTEIGSLLSVNMDEYILWYRFINDEQDSNVEFHTYHGVKGLEYDNVMIVMQNKFGRNSNKFSKFLTHIGEDTIPTDTKDKTDFENTRNLLYVACSRAIVNLSVLYLDETEEFGKGIETLFDTVSDFTI